MLRCTGAAGRAHPTRHKARRARLPPGPRGVTPPPPGAGVRIRTSAAAGVSIRLLTSRLTTSTKRTSITRPVIIGGGKTPKMQLMKVHAPGPAFRYSWTLYAPQTESAENKSPAASQAAILRWTQFWAHQAKPGPGLLVTQKLAHSGHNRNAPGS